MLPIKTARRVEYKPPNFSLEPIPEENIDLEELGRRGTVLQQSGSRVLIVCGSRHYLADLEIEEPQEARR